MSVNFISINPDTHTVSGHYFFYDFNLMKMCEENLLSFNSLCWKSTPEIGREIQEKFLPTFSSHSWTIGNKGILGVNSAITNQFSEELNEGIAKIQNLTNIDKSILYMYTGSLHHAEIIAKTVLAEDNLVAVINLFWLPFLEVESLEFKKRWSTFLNMMSKSSKICLTVTTVEMQEVIEHEFGIRFGLAPHPCTSFSDSDFLKRKIDIRSSDTAKQNFNILFPGRLGSGKLGLKKGYLLTTETIVHLSKRKDTYSYEYECALRQFSDINQPQASKAIEELQGIAKFIDGELSEADFAKMLEWADIIVLPYYKSIFARRTSGLFTDSLYLGKPVVALKETWMGNRIEEFCCGEIADNDSESLANAIESVMNNYFHYQKNASIAASRWFQSNSWLSLFGSIVLPEFPFIRCEREDPSFSRRG